VNTVTGELRFEFFRSSGPGGQNVNKVATAVRLRFDVGGSRLLEQEVKERLVRLAGRRVTSGGILVIEAQRFRTQERNRQDAVARLMTLIERSRKKPHKRLATKPTTASKNRRLDDKRSKGGRKRERGAVQDTGE
jgi:ribosome-associated protein